LILELSWARRLSLLTGNGIRAGAAVVAVTVAGLALGSLWGGRRADRSARPLVVFALLEAGVSFWALATPSLFRILPRLALAGGAGAALDLDLPAFAATALLLLPGTFLMGATTPFLVRHAAGRWLLPSRNDPPEGPGGALLGSLYGWNTLGGAAGAVLTIFVLMPRLGITGAIRSAALVDGLVAVTILALLRDQTPGTIRSDSFRGAEARPSGGGPPLRRMGVLAALAVAGALGGAFQMIWTRLLVLFFGSSVHSLGIALTAHLAGLALGSGWAGRRLEGRRKAEAAAREALLLLSVSVTASVPLWGAAPPLISIARSRMGESFGAALALQGLLSLLLMFPAAFALGALLPSLTALLPGGATGAGQDSGEGYSLDSWGTAAGTLAAVLLLAGGLGVERMLRIAGIAAVALLIPLRVLQREQRPAPGWSSRRALLPAGCLIFLVFLPRWDPVLMTAGPLLYAGSYARNGRSAGAVEEAMHRRGALRLVDEGPEATVTVREGAGGVLSLQINGKTDASTGGDLPTQILAGRIPALLRPGARSVLVIGLASGTTAGALLEESPQRLDCVEISPGVARAERFFASANGSIRKNPRFHLHLGDGRAYLQRTSLRYDIIASQPTNPWIAGVTNLFTLEFFQLARDRLSQGGILAVWLQGYAFHPGDFRSAVATFLRVFPEAQLWEESAGGGDFFLVGRNDGGPPPLEAVQRGLVRTAGPLPSLTADGLEGAAGFLSRFVAGARGLAEFSRGAPVVTDDNLRLEYSAPRALWDDRVPELIASLEEIRESPLDYFPPSPPEEASLLQFRLRQLESQRSQRIRLALSLRRPDYEALSIPELFAAAALIRRGLPDAALPLLRQAIGQAEEAPSLRLLEGWILLDRGETEEAARAFHAARNLDPASAEAANGEGLSAWKAGDLERAKSLFGAAERLASRDPEPGNNLASVLLAQGKEEEALPWLDGIVERHPRFVPARINRGVALARLGRLAEAERDYRKALELDPGNADAEYNLGRVRERARGIAPGGRNPSRPAEAAPPPRP
jgi:spermidine synthase